MWNYGGGGGKPILHHLSKFTCNLSSYSYDKTTWTHTTDKTVTWTTGMPFYWGQITKSPNCSQLALTILLLVSKVWQLLRYYHEFSLNIRFQDHEIIWVIFFLIGDVKIRCQQNIKALKLNAYNVGGHLIYAYIPSVVMMQIKYIRWR